MTPPAYEERLREILDALRDTLAFVRDMSQAGFEALPEEDRKTYRAIKNAVSEIGEAVKALPPEICARHPSIDWRGLAGLRDVVVHQYSALDLRRLWPVLSDEFPVLLQAIAEELGEDIPDEPRG